MIEDFVNALAGHCVAVRTATRARVFLAEVEHFIARLKALPHHPVADVTEQQFELINRLSDEMIEEIERRIETGDDSAEARQALAESVYRIRRRVEEIYRWHPPGGKA